MNVSQSTAVVVVVIRQAFVVDAVQVRDGGVIKPDATC